MLAEACSTEGRASGGKAGQSRPAQSAPKRRARGMPRAGYAVQPVGSPASSGATGSGAQRPGASARCSWRTDCSGTL